MAAALNPPLVGPCPMARAGAQAASGYSLVIPRRSKRLRPLPPTWVLEWPAVYPRHPHPPHGRTGGLTCPVPSDASWRVLTRFVRHSGARRIGTGIFARKTLGADVPDLDARAWRPGRVESSGRSVGPAGSSAWQTQQVDQGVTMIHSLEIHSAVMRHTLGSRPWTRIGVFRVLEWLGRVIDYPGHGDPASRTESSANQGIGRQLDGTSAR